MNPLKLLLLIEQKKRKKTHKSNFIIQHFSFIQVFCVLVEQTRWLVNTRKSILRQLLWFHSSMLNKEQEHIKSLEKSK